MVIVETAICSGYDVKGFHVEFKCFCEYHQQLEKQEKKNKKNEKTEDDFRQEVLGRDDMQEVGPNEKDDEDDDLFVVKKKKRKTKKIQECGKQRFYKVSKKDSISILGSLCCPNNIYTIELEPSFETKGSKPETFYKLVSVDFVRSIKEKPTWKDICSYLKVNNFPYELKNTLEIFIKQKSKKTELIKPDMIDNLYNQQREKKFIAVFCFLFTDKTDLKKFLSIQKYLEITDIKIFYDNREFLEIYPYATEFTIQEMWNQVKNFKQNRFIEIDKPSEEERYSYAILKCHQLYNILLRTGFVYEFQKKKIYDQAIEKVNEENEKLKRKQEVNENDPQKNNQLDFDFEDEHGNNLGGFEKGEEESSQKEKVDEGKIFDEEIQPHLWTDQMIELFKEDEDIIVSLSSSPKSIQLKKNK